VAVAPEAFESPELPVEPVAVDLDPAVAAPDPRQQQASQDAHDQQFFALVKRLSMLVWDLPSRQVACDLNIAAVVSPRVWTREHTAHAQAASALDKAAGLPDLPIAWYVQCGGCCSMYTLDEIIEKDESVAQEKYLAMECPYQDFPNHALHKHRGNCLTELAWFPKSDHLASNARAKLLTPVADLTECLDRILRRPSIAAVLDHWKARADDVPLDVFGDVYEGAVWREFLYYPTGTGEAFLAGSGIGLILNVDWFQPMENTQFSEGAIYLAILNLPRRIRFIKENMILVSAFATPKGNEKDCNLDRVLEKVVDQLLLLWAPGNGLGRRVALLCVACDLPAARKLIGFKGHGALCGCSRCSRVFGTYDAGAADPTYDKKSIPRTNYGENVCVVGENRTNAGHRRQAEEWRDQTTIGGRARSFKENGVRDSEVLRLPYFDPSRMTAADPMHGLYLGTAKKLLQLWRAKGYLSKTTCEELERRMAAMGNVPRDVGRIINKFDHKLAKLLAAEMRNFTHVFSASLLYDLVGFPQAEFDLWMHFVQGCRLMAKRVVSRAELDVGHQHMKDFLNEFVKLHGEMAVTTNMHMHLHLRDFILDFGPVAGFWCFAFERFNGDLGNTQNNGIGRQIGGTMMQAFHSYTSAMDIISDAAAQSQWTERELGMFRSIVWGSRSGDQSPVGILQAPGPPARPTWPAKVVCKCLEASKRVLNDAAWATVNGSGPLPAMFVKSARYHRSYRENEPISRDDRAQLQRVVSLMYGTDDYVHTPYVFVESGARLRVCGEVFTSLDWRRGDSSHLVTVLGEDNRNEGCKATAFPCEVRYYCRVEVRVFDRRRVAQLTRQKKQADERRRAAGSLVESRHWRNASEKLQRQLDAKSGRVESHMLAAVDWFRAPTKKDVSRQKHSELETTGPWRWWHEEYRPNNTTDTSPALDYGFIPVNAIHARFVRAMRDFSRPKEDRGQVFQACELTRQFEF
jgi:hypothetical protein